MKHQSKTPTTYSFIATVKKQIMYNITPILFGMLIVFVVLSIVKQRDDTKKQIQALLDYAETTTPYIVSQTVTITNTSLLSQNDQSSYQTIITSLQELKTYCVERIATIPRYPADPKVVQFVTELISYLNDIIDSIDIITVQLTTIQELLPSLNTISQAQTIITTGSDSDLINLIKQAKTVHQTIENLKSSSSTYLFITTEYFDTYESITTLAHSTTTEQLSEPIDTQLRSSITQQIEGKYPLSTTPYPIVRRYQIENEQYVVKIKQLQSQLAEIKQSYSL